MLRTAKFLGILIACVMLVLMSAGLPKIAKADSLQPELLTPSNGCNGCPVHSLSFSWAPFRETTKYLFQLAKDPTMTQIVNDVDVSSAAYEYDGTLDYSASYFWRVVAVEPTPSDWSATFSFSTETAPIGKLMGIDVSAYQHLSGANINWPSVYSQNYKFAYVKATEGGKKTNRYFEEDMNAGFNAGLKMGAYHFARPDLNNPTDEVACFISITKTYLHEGYLRPMLDVEDPAKNIVGGWGTLATWIHQWMDTFESQTGIKPIIYLNHDYSTNLCSVDPTIKEYDLWICDLDYSPPRQACWYDWSFWQYSWTGSVSGITGPVDMDYFNGDISKLNLFIIATVLQPTQNVTTATGTGTATFTTSDGSITALTTAVFTPCGTFSSFSFPHGFFSYNVINVTPGATVTITIVLPSPVPVGTQYWKCQNGRWYRITVGDDDGDNVITIQLVDGGIGDADGQANGTIVDPGGPAVPVQTPPAHRVSPTLTNNLRPAQMSVQYLNINPQRAAANQPVTILTNVVNTGDEAGSLNVALKINGQVEQTKMVSVGPQGTQPIKHTVTRAQPGTYAVEIGGQQGSFTILAAGKSAGTPLNGGFIAILIICILIVVTAMMLMLTFRRPV